MSRPVICAEKLSKWYNIPVHPHQPTQLVDIIGPWFQHILSTPWRRPPSVATPGFWALRDVSFEVERGEKLAIIGHNGAGKSTLLSILADITEPTAGQVVIRGRTGALFSNRPGFHRELSGRENIYLGGSILGLRPRDIDHKFDEIVEFAGVAQFIDMPFKHYSQGMQARLGFSVSMHLEPDILLIDEVLSTGDVAFRQKAVVKLQELSQTGMTIIFVSHNLAMLQTLCSRAILLQKGQLIAQGDIESIVSQSMASS